MVLSTIEEAAAGGAGEAGGATAAAAAARRYTVTSQRFVGVEHCVGGELLRAPAQLVERAASAGRGRRPICQPGGFQGSGRSHRRSRIF